MKGTATAIAVCLAAVLVLSTACGSTLASAAKTTTATVQRGSLSVSVTGTGNLALSTSQELAFQIAGYVSEIMVKEGDSVKKGQQLAKLDTSQWEKQIKKLETALTTAQRNLDSKNRALLKAQDLVTSKQNAIDKAQRTVDAKDNAIARAERNVASKELAVRSAELDVQSAEYNLTKIAEVKTAQDDIDNAEFTLKLANGMLAGGQGGTAQIDIAYWGQMALQAQGQLTNARDRMQEILKGTSLSVTTNVKLQVAKAHLQITQSKRAVDEARIAVTEAKNAVEDARLDKKDAELAVKDAMSAKADAEQSVLDAQTAVNDARQAVADAQADLDEAKGLSPIIVAPIDGFIPKINVKGGDEVFKGRVAMHIADPNQYEAVILVSEKNISNLRVGQSATVALDALSGAIFPAQIANIAPLATTSQGVVNYQVTVKLLSSQPIGTRATAGQGAQSSGNMTAQRPTGAVPKAQSGAAQQRPAATARAGSQAAASATASAQTMTLKSGLSAVVTIVIQQKNDVLKVPSRAITRQGQNATVQVITEAGVETRAVKVGMSDSSSTEIIEGLSEGETVEIKAGTTATATSGQSKAPAKAPSIGGIRLG